MVWYAVNIGTDSDVIYCWELSVNELRADLIKQH